MTLWEVSLSSSLQSPSHGSYTWSGLLYRAWKWVSVWPVPMDQPTTAAQPPEPLMWSPAACLPHHALSPSLSLLPPKRNLFWRRGRRRSRSGWTLLPRLLACLVLHQSPWVGRCQLLPPHCYEPPVVSLRYSRSECLCSLLSPCTYDITVHIMYVASMHRSILHFSKHIMHPHMITLLSWVSW